MTLQTPTTVRISTSPEDIAHMKAALELSYQVDALPTNYCVGALIVDPSSNNVLATGYTMELPGNTHAEQNCFTKLSESKVELPEDGASLYTTMEPCGVRLSGNLPCVDRVLETRKGGRKGIKTVYMGVSEPGDLVKENGSVRRLLEAGVEVVKIEGFEDDILKSAKRGHVQKDERKHD
jgi:pyrimidine deaminase RibD-like protein